MMCSITNRHSKPHYVVISTSCIGSIQVKFTNELISSNQVYSKLDPHANRARS
jgi:hypothetical protein